MIKNYNTNIKQRKHFFRRSDGGNGETMGNGMKMEVQGGKKEGLGEQ